MLKLVFSEPAKAEIDAIWDYTFETWGGDQADHYNRLIEEACLALCHGTQSGLSADHVLAGYRMLHVGSHTIYFRQTEKEIEVIRILHQNMDVGIQLG